MYNEKPIDPLFVDDFLTPLTEEQAAIVLRSAFKNLTGKITIAIGNDGNWHIYYC